MSVATTGLVHRESESTEIDIAPLKLTHPAYLSAFTCSGNIPKSETVWFATVL